LPLTYEQLREIIYNAGFQHFRLEEVRRDGKTVIYRGGDIQAFWNRKDQGFHEHRVIDDQERLIYHRDINGKLHVGDVDQWKKYLRKRMLGEAAMGGAVGGAMIFSGSLRRALRWWGMGRKK
jgi:hypothetical protein